MNCFGISVHWIYSYKYKQVFLQMGSSFPSYGRQKKNTLEKRKTLNKKWVFLVFSAMWVLTNSFVRSSPFVLRRSKRAQIKRLPQLRPAADTWSRWQLRCSCQLRVLGLSSCFWSHHVARHYNRHTCRRSKFLWQQLLYRSSPPFSNLCVNSETADDLIQHGVSQTWSTRKKRKKTLVIVNININSQS